MTPEQHLIREVEGLLASYSALERHQADVDATIKERTREVYSRLDGHDDELKTKADSKDVLVVAGELRAIKRLLLAVLLAIIAASIGFGFAALQIAGQGIS